MTKLKDIVVILPGITGSVLQKDGRDFWGVSGTTIWDFIRTGGESLDALKVKDDDPDAEHLDDGVKAVRLVEDVTIIPGLFKVDGYTKTTKMITDNFTKVTQGDIYNDPEDKPANLYHFPYDWRRDNRPNAKLLQKLINKRLKTWRERENPNAKVILLAHSMGGLVSRYYLEVLGGWQDCKALFTFGTPYRGSLNAVNFLANGYKKWFIDLTEAMRSMNSVYQLMPRYEALKIGNKYYRVAQPPHGITLPNIDPSKAQDALKFHDGIDDAADVNYKDNIYYQSFVTCPIVGVMQPTQQMAELINGKIQVSQTLPKVVLDNAPNCTDGDGTVPQISATPIQMNDQQRLAIVDYIAESHGSLQNQQNILLSLLNKFQTAQDTTPQNVRGAIESVDSRSKSAVKGIGLEVEDLYLPDEAIVLKAKVSEGVSFNRLIAEITEVNQENSPIQADFTLENNTWTLTRDSLTAGTYRVKVYTDNQSEDAPIPVHNLFEVANQT